MPYQSVIAPTVTDHSLDHRSDHTGRCVERLDLKALLGVVGIPAVSIHGIAPCTGNAPRKSGLEQISVVGLASEHES